MSMALVGGLLHPALKFMIDLKAMLRPQHAPSTVQSLYSKSSTTQQETQAAQSSTAASCT
jgi:hypothetical protein